MKSTFSDKTWIEIDSKNLAHNAEVLSEYVGNKVEMGAMLKANAYGHGVAESTLALHKIYSIFYAVLVSDALIIRKKEKDAGLLPKRILVVGAINAGDLNLLCEHNIECAITESDWRVKLDNFAGVKNQKLKVHIFIDSGLGREGLRWDSISKDLDFLEIYSNKIEVVGAMTHFSDAECAYDLDFAQTQLANFKSAVIDLKNSRLLPENAELHTAASSPAIVFPEARFGMVRFGLSAYGYWTSRDSQLATARTNECGKTELLELKPALSWRAKSVVVKTVKAGESVGYNRAFKCQKDTKIAVLPVGYFDGYPYASHAQFFVLIKGKRCPVLGCIMMNNIVVDVSDLEVGDDETLTATLIGRDGSETITADDLARIAKTINYHILASLGIHLVKYIT